MRITHSLRKRYLGEEWPWVKDEKPFRPYNYILSTFLASFLSTLIFSTRRFLFIYNFSLFCMCMSGRHRFPIWKGFFINFGFF